MEPEWLVARRKAGASQAADLGLPTTKTPGWQFTDLAELVEEDFSLPNGGDPAARERADAVLNPPEDAPRIVQVDGTPLESGTLSGAEGAERPTEPLVSTLADAAERYPELVAEKLGSVAAPDDPFVARNDAAWRGGAFVYVPAGQRLEHPAQIAAVHDADRAAIGFRTLIVLEEGAEAEVWEQWLATDHERSGLFNAVTEVFVGAAATLHYVTAQGLGERSWVFATQRAEVERDATLDWVALGFGSARGKVRMETRLAGQGSTARVTGAYAGNGTQHLDFDTTQEHAAHSTVSDLAFRGILNEQATAVWRGMIKVDPGAQQTDAFQESRNLLLSKSAHADAIPGLEIEADDVRCTHAAAIAQIDAEQLHYLRAHGLPEGDAKRLVIEGFLEALVERLGEGPVKAAVSVALERRLGEILGERYT
ncbi:MAG TPA: Fe-S cluster assembly protein SufD [Solirubrobacterales bacterium]|nr:Fe-S cluster assembly protein SufD [Solirubrobacterales bacterium]